MPDQPASPSDWPGRRLGLPESGPRSVGRLGRRIGAFLIDSAVAAAVAFVFFDYDRWAVLAVFAVLQVVVILLFNGGIGHLVVGLRVVPDKGGRLKFWQPFVRTVLLLLLIPAIIWDRDQRGMHDRLAGTILVLR